MNTIEVLQMDLADLTRENARLKQHLAVAEASERSQQQEIERLRGLLEPCAFRQYCKCINCQKRREALGDE